MARKRTTRQDDEDTMVEAAEASEQEVSSPPTKQRARKKLKRMVYLIVYRGVDNHGPVQPQFASFSKEDRDERFEGIGAIRARRLSKMEREIVTEDYLKEMLLGMDALECLVLEQELGAEIPGKK